MQTVSDVMTRGIRTLAPTDSLTLAAEAMRELDVGSIPVCDGVRLVGMVTDRDIVLRGVAQQRDPASLRLADVMSANVRCVREGDDVDMVLGEMGDAQIRRMPVVDDRDRLVGIVTLGDIAAKDTGGNEEVAASLGEISAPAEPDRSGQSQASGAAGGGSAKPHRQPG